MKCLWIVFSGTLAMWSAFGAGVRIDSSIYTIAERDLPGVTGGAATCYMQTYPNCPASANYCNGCTVAGVPCPGGSNYISQLMSYFPQGMPFAARGWSSNQDQGSVMCRRFFDCQTCILSGAGIVCPVGSAGVDYPLVGHRKSLATGTVCGY